MAGEIYIADKATLDLVKTDTTAIKTDTSTIKSDTAFIKSNMSGGIDFSKYTQFSNSTNNRNTVAKTTTELFSITGSGYIDNMKLIGINLGGSYFEIFVDNVSIMKFCATNSWESALVTSDYILGTYVDRDNGDEYLNVLCQDYNNSDVMWVSRFGTSASVVGILNYRNTDINKWGLCILKTPILFNSSFKLKFVNNNTTDISISMGYRGGLK